LPIEIFERLGTGSLEVTLPLEIGMRSWFFKAFSGDLNAANQRSAANLASAIATFGKPARVAAEAATPVVNRLFVRVVQRVELGFGNRQRVCGFVCRAIGGYLCSLRCFFMSDSPLLRQQQLADAQPASAEVRIELARLLMQAGRLPEAAETMQQAIALGPGNLAACYNNLGVIQFHRGDFFAAVGSFRHAISLSGNDAGAHNNLGDALRRSGQLDTAASSYQDAIRLNPGFAQARSGLGLTLYLLGRFRQAIEQLEIAIRFDPRNSDANSNLMLCHVRLAEHQPALAAARRAVEIEPGNAEFHSHLISLMNYVEWDDPAEILQESREWDQRHGKTPRNIVHGNNRDPDRRLRVGYISPDFKDHPVAFFLEPVLANHDRREFSVACYAEVRNPDGVTERMKSYVDLWRSTIWRSHDVVAEQIRADGIDILIDLCGHLVDNRLEVLARKPAPIQATWLGYPNTSGLAAIDYRFTDEMADPIGSTEALYSEKLVRLPGAFFVYLPPPDAPAVAALPMLDRGCVTFGSFNNLTKITPPVADLWARLLLSMPQATLLLAGLSGDRAQQARAMFRQRGVSDAQLEIVGWMNFREYFETFGRVDIGLDPFPWNGHTTTCHSLWMGVPVVSLAGRAALSRAGMSVMGNLGMGAEWVAQNPAAYLALAQSWAKNPNGLAEVRGNLRERMQRSPLLDAAGFTKGFEKILRDLWRQWCR
jgi:protein O-GlcNAc transferase